MRICEYQDNIQHSQSDQSDQVNVSIWHVKSQLGLVPQPPDLRLKSDFLQDLAVFLLCFTSWGRKTVNLYLLKFFILYVPFCAFVFAFDFAYWLPGQPWSISLPSEPRFTCSGHFQRVVIFSAVSFRLGLRLPDQRGDLARGPGSVLKKGGR